MKAESKSSLMNLVTSLIKANQELYSIISDLTERIIELEENQKEEE